jgi:hypothetical protein
VGSTASSDHTSIAIDKASRHEDGVRRVRRHEWFAVDLANLNGAIGAGEFGEC